MKNSFGMLLLLVGIWILPSCEEDENGPVTGGPPGPAGAQGPQGPAGQNGALSVFYRDISLLAADWKHVPVTTNHFDTATVAVAEITPAVIDSGVVVMYHRVGSVYHLMPHSTFNGLSETVLSGYFYPGGVVFTSYMNSVGGPHAGPQEFRLMIATRPLRMKAPAVLPAEPDPVAAGF